MSDEPFPEASTSTNRRTVLLALAALPLTAQKAGAVTMPSQPTQLGETSVRLPTIVFDVNETILDFSVLLPVFIRVFGDPKALREWFNQVVLYSEALTLAGEYVDSGSVGVAVLKMLAEIGGRKVEDSDFDELKQLSATMPTYADTPDALAVLKKAGFRLVTLSNNPTAGVETQLAHAGLRSFFDELHSIDDQVHRYKPARESYVSLAGELGVSPSDLWLVSCHAFDTLGAAAAGYRTALVLRPQNAPIALGRPPDITGSDLRSVVEALVQVSGRQRRN